MNKVRSSYVVTHDVQKLIPFYEALLETKLQFQDGKKWAQFPTDTGRFAISSPDEAAAPGLSSVIVIEVEDMAYAEANVLKHGGQILSRRDMGSHGITVTFSDPADNVSQLFFKPKS
jgi:predicted enzyme related to lactoylglutathione lyase